MWRSKVDSLSTDGSQVMRWGPTPTEIEDVMSAGTEWTRFDTCQETASDSHDGELMSSDDEDGIILEEDPQEDEYILDALATLELSDERKEAEYHERQDQMRETVGLRDNSVASTVYDDV